MRDDVLAMLAAGQLTAEQIAAEVGISRRTVFHIAEQKRREIDAAAAKAASNAAPPEPQP